MDELFNLLSLYEGNPKKFEKAVKKATRGKFSGNDVVISSLGVIRDYLEGLKSGALRPVRTTEDLFSVTKLSKHLIGKEVFRVWNGGRNGKICSKVIVKGIITRGDSTSVETQADYSANYKDPVVRKLNLADLNITWFLDEVSCKKAIERM